MSGTITWHEDQKTGTGILTLRLDDGSRETVVFAEPITSRSDSSHIAAMFGDWDWVEHNGEFIHCGMNS